MSTFSSWTKGTFGKKQATISLIYGTIIASIPILKLFGLDAIAIASHIPMDERIPIALTLIFIIYVVFVAHNYQIIDKPERTNPTEEKLYSRLQVSEIENAESTDDITSVWVDYKRAVNKTLRQFSWFWFLCWIFWFIFYFFLFLKMLELITFPTSALQNFLNNTSSLMFAFMYMTLSVSTSKYTAINWIQFGLIIMLITVTEVIFGNDGNAFYFKLISGLFSCVAMAAFVGSINSKFINIPSGLILLLYIYSAIQFGYIFLDKQVTGSTIDPFLSLLILSLALILKIILFLVITWVIDTGRLLYFVVEEGSLNYIKNRDYEEFFNILKRKSLNL